MEKTIFYILMFCIGTLFGNFLTLAIYRLPLHKNITHKRSCCPKCNHKLSFFDMIPIFSYIFLGGKCRYCKAKINIRYLFLEIFTGILFLMFTISLNFNFAYLEISKLIYLLVGLLYLVGLIIISGIDKEKKIIFKAVMLYEIILLSMYMIYLYIVENINVYRYIIYLFLICIFLMISNSNYKKKLKNNYTIDIIILSIIMTLFTNELIYVLTVIFTLIIISFNIIIYNIKSKLKKGLKNKQDTALKLPIGFYLCCGNIVVLLFIDYMACR